MPAKAIVEAIITEYQKAKSELLKDF